jgi:hypothetical protein
MKLFLFSCSLVVCCRRELYPSIYTGSKAVLQLSLVWKPSFHHLCMPPCHRQMKEGTSGASMGSSAPWVGHPFDRLRWPPPSHGGFWAGLRVHPRGAFSLELEFGWATLCFFGLDAPFAFPDCVFCHVFHSCILQNMLVPKLVESVSKNP